MFDFVHNHKRLVQFMLALVALPFAFFGVDSYVRTMSSDKDVATVGGQAVTPQDYENALRNQQAQMQRMLGKNYDPAMFENPEVKQQVLDGVVNQRLLQVVGQDMKLAASDAEVNKVISSIPDFQEDGKFSDKKAAEVLQANRLTVPGFRANVRNDLAMQTLQDPLARSGFASAAQVALYQRLTEQGREVQVATLDVNAFMAQAKVDDAAIKAEYEKSPDSYRAPEQVKIEYLQLDQATFLNSVTVTADEVKVEYDKRVKEFSAPEERRASHILLSVDKDDKGQPKQASKDSAKAEAEALLKQVGTTVEAFAALAKTKSKDPGSAAQGGDLGFFGRGQMVKPFEDAVFAMKPGEVRGPIESDFGFHIIRLTEVKAERVKPLEEVKAQIEGELKQQKASKMFAENAEKFQNRVYEAGDSYTKLAEELKLEVKKTDWMSRAQIQAIAAGNQKFPQTIFASANIAAKKNSEAIDLGNSRLISARVLEHKPSAVRPLEEVKPQIQIQLQRRAAMELAAKAGAEKLTLVAAGKDAGVTFSAAQKVLRQQPAPNVNQALLKSIFAASLAKGEAAVGGPNDAGGFTLVKVLKVVEPDALAADKAKSLSQRLAGQNSGDLTSAYLGALKERVKVEIKKGAIADKPAEQKQG